MLVYATHPIIHTSQIISALARESHDPITQVVCLAFDKETNTLTGYGVNKILKPFQNHMSAKKLVSTPLEPAKKFLMVHAETDFLNKNRNTMPHVIQRTSIYMSLQPCMSCLAGLLQAGYTDIQWAADNRHQEEQTLMSPFLSIIEYRKNAEGLHLQVPSWILKANELR